MQSPPFGRVPCEDAGASASTAYEGLLGHPDPRVQSKGSGHHKSGGRRATGRQRCPGFPGASSSTRRPLVVTVSTAASGRRLSPGSWGRPHRVVRAQGRRRQAEHVVRIKFYILSDQIYKMKNRFTKTCPEDNAGDEVQNHSVRPSSGRAPQRDQGAWAGLGLRSSPSPTLWFLFPLNGV